MNIYGIAADLRSEPKRTKMCRKQLARDMPSPLLTQILQANSDLSKYIFCFLGTVEFTSPIAALKYCSLFPAAPISIISRPERFCSTIAYQIGRVLRISRNVHTLDLTGNYVRSEKALAEIVHTLTSAGIRNINFTANDFGDKGAEILSQMLTKNKSVKVLDLSCNGIDEDGILFLSQCLEHNSCLESLDLTSNKLGKKGTEYLAQGLAINRRLSSLNLTATLLKDASGISFILKRNSALSHLNLSDNAIGDLGAQKLRSGLKGNKMLRFLELNRCGIHWKGAKSLTEGLKANDTLDRLSLSENNIDSRGASFFAHAIAKNINLKCLNIEKNNIKNSGLVYISKALRYNSNLSELNIAWNSIYGSESIDHLATTIERSSSLTKLCLQGNIIEDIGATMIFRALTTNKSVTHLDLMYSEIRDSAALYISIALRSNSTLTRLSIGGNRIGTTGTNFLKLTLDYNKSLESIDILDRNYLLKKTPKSPSSCAPKENSIAGFTNCFMEELK